MGYYIYILECADGTWYTGWTTDPERRLKVHNSGKGAKYTRSRRPVRLIYTETFETAVEAQRREYAIKRLTRAQKEAIVAGKGIKTVDTDHAGNGTKTAVEDHAGNGIKTASEDHAGKGIKPADADHKTPGF